MTMDSGDETDLLNSSLTNLQWLQHINMDLNDGLNLPRRTIASSSFNSSSTSSLHLSKEDRHSNGGGVDYSRNSMIKPPYSYATLICMAIRETPKHKITLSAIYNWIMTNFAYYRHADPSWQNSIRHNLSLNKCFLKVPRDKDEPGKGGFWMINADYEDDFKNGVFKRRKPKKIIKKSPYLKSNLRVNIYNPGKVRKYQPQKYQKIEICNFNPTPSLPMESSVSHHEAPIIKIPSFNFNSMDYSAMGIPRNCTTMNMRNHSNVRNLGNVMPTPELALPTIRVNSCTPQHPEVISRSTTANSTLPRNDPHQALDLVLKDIQLNSYDTAEVPKKTDGDLDIFRQPDFNWETLTDDLTSPEINELVRDIESLIETPAFDDPQLFIKGEKLASSTLCSDDNAQASDWGSLLDDISLGNNLETDFLDGLAGLV